MNMTNCETYKVNDAAAVQSNGVTVTLFIIKYSVIYSVVEGVLR